MAHSSPLNSCSKLGFFPEALQTDKIITVQTSEISLCNCCIWSNSQGGGGGVQEEGSHTAVYKKSYIRLWFKTRNNWK